MLIDQVSSLFRPFWLPETSAQIAGDAGQADVSGSISLHTARLVGSMLAIVMIVGTMLLIPMNGYATIMQDLFAFAGLLLGNVAVIALSRCLPDTVRSQHLLAMLPLTFIAVFAAASGYSAPLVLTILALICFDIIIQNGMKGRAELGLMLGGGTATFIAGLVLAQPDITACLLLFGIYLPIIVGASLRLEGVSRHMDALGDQGRINHALLKAALHRQPLTLLMVDKGGMIETSTASADEDCDNLAALLAPGQCIANAILVSDRVPLFHAISEAVHKSRATEQVLVRLREVMPEGGYRQPPRFFAHHVSVLPAAGIAGRAMLAFLPVKEGEEEASTPRPIGFSARALHDFVSPFNAGLGFLEMLADPHLAPKDADLSRQYAQKAHEAVTQAYRNAILLARVLKSVEAQAQGTASAPQRIEPVMQDAARALANNEVQARLRLTSVGLADLGLRNPEAARLALQILIRAGLHAAPADAKLVLEAKQDDADGCHFILHVQGKGGWDWPTPDAFDSNLEALGAQLCGGRYTRHAEVGMILSLPGCALIQMKNTPISSITPPSNKAGTSTPPRADQNAALRHAS